MPIVADELTLKAKLFRGLADPSRLTILEALRGGPLHVGALVERTGLSQPNVSMHLACLWGCGLVKKEPRGRFVYYRIESNRVEKLLGQAESVLARVAEHIYRCTRNK